MDRSRGFYWPGVMVSEGSVIGVHAVLFKDAVPHGVYVGNPAVLVKHRSLFQVNGNA